MAKFRDSQVDFSSAAEAPALKPVATAAFDGDGQGPEVADRTIGDILAELRNLTVEQVAKALHYQQSNGVRFGEAAVALGFVSKEDVLVALAQQFHYPYAPGESNRLSADVVTLSEPFSPRAESFRALRSQLMMRVFIEGKPSQALAVISPDAGDGKTYCASNLAVTLAQLGGKTLLVDADMRSPSVHKVFNLPNKAGLSGILSGRADKQVIQQVAGVPTLFVLPVGTIPPNPLELVERPAFGLLMRELASKFDYVVVDTPAAEFGADAAVIAAKCGAALLVARKNVTSSDALRELVAAFHGAAVEMAGVVFNEI